MAPFHSGPGSDPSVRVDGHCRDTSSLAATLEIQRVWGGDAHQCRSPVCGGAARAIEEAGISAGTGEVSQAQWPRPPFRRPDRPLERVRAGLRRGVPCIWRVAAHKYVETLPTRPNIIYSEGNLWGHKRRIGNVEGFAETQVYHYPDPAREAKWKYHKPETR
jgi:hypothetical protein